MAMIWSESRITAPTRINHVELVPLLNLGANFTSNSLAYYAYLAGHLHFFFFTSSIQRWKASQQQKSISESGWKHWKNTEGCLGLYNLRVSEVTWQSLTWSSSCIKTGKKKLFLSIPSVCHGLSPGLYCKYKVKSCLLSSVPMSTRNSAREDDLGSVWPRDEVTGESLLLVSLCVSLSLHLFQVVQISRFKHCCVFVVDLWVCCCGCCFFFK